MEKSQQKVNIVVCIILAVTAFGTLFLMFNQNFMQNFMNSEPTVITELNQPYENDGVRITATDVKSINFPDSDSQIIVGIKWKFENISNENCWINVGSKATAYVDDIAVSNVYNRINPEENVASGELAVGKQTVGYYCVKAPKDAKRIELNYKDDYDFNANVTFVFDIPPVEE